jgi:hypothetical protein
MSLRFAFVLALFATTSVVAQEWNPFLDGAAFGTYGTETGPKKPQNRIFSTNWLMAGAERDIGSGGMILARARFSLEPFTIPKEGYPQLLQYVSARSGGHLVDAMRAHDLIEEVAVGFEWRPLALRLAPVGEPPLGAQAYEQRLSSIDFAEAPFGYDVQESFHRATRVVSAGITTRTVDLEYGVFHESSSTGRHTSIDDGNIDSWGARLTIAPESRLSAQISTGRLGDAKSKLSSASISYNGTALATSAIWTKREDLSAWSVESSLRAGRSVLMARAEWVDRPLGIFTTTEKRTAHVTAGYIFDIVRRGRQRAGIGINADYHNASRTLEPSYGHKPQNVYLFLRWRTERITPPVSP